MKVNNSILGILGAAAVGATLGILFAPNKGSETRKKIVKDGKELTNDIKSNIDIVMSEVSEKFNAVKEEGKEIIATGKEKLNTIKEKGKETIANNADKLSEAVKEA